MTVYANSSIHNALSSLPRQNLGFFPTPLERLPHLSDELGVDVWMKRDDQTGLALGGNKVRKLEFLLGDALEHGADVIVTTGGSQSNHARLTAAACRRLSLDCYLVLDRGRHPESGNLLLDHLLGATVEIIEDARPEIAAARMNAVVEKLRGEGATPYLIPRGGSVPQGAVGYLNMVSELQVQMLEIGLAADFVYLATGSGGTHSGVVAGNVGLGCSWSVRGVSVSRSAEVQQQKVLELSNGVLSILSHPDLVNPGHVQVDDGFVGAGYGVPTDACWDAIRLLALTEAVVLDPVYTGKAMAGLVGHVRDGLVPKGSTVVFIHTGGSPALFAYASEAEVLV